MPNEFGKKFRQLRQENGWSLRQLSRYLGATAAYISQVELGQKLPMSDHKILIAASIFNVDPEELLILAACQRPIVIDTVGLPLSEIRRAVHFCLRW
jgi:transcriptional regulator with XRE-family HTH domain